jgi:anti-sigma B factor antagonist
MRSETRSNILHITDIPTLTSDLAGAFKALARATITPAHQVLEVDLGHARTVDSEGLGALVAINKDMRAQGGKVVLLNPSPLIGQILHLLKLDEIFQITRG